MWSYNTINVKGDRPNLKPSNYKYSFIDSFKNMASNVMNNIGIIYAQPSETDYDNTCNLNDPYVLQSLSSFLIEESIKRKVKSNPDVVNALAKKLMKEYIEQNKNKGIEKYKKEYYVRVLYEYSLNRLGWVMTDDVYKVSVNTNEPSEYKRANGSLTAQDLNNINYNLARPVETNNIRNYVRQFPGTKERHNTVNLVDKDNDGFVETAETSCRESLVYKHACYDNIVDLVDRGPYPYDYTS